MRSVKIAIFGLGTVGGGVVRILQNHQADFAHRSGVDIQIAAVNSRSNASAVKLGVGQLFRSADEIFSDPSIDIVVELIGGTGYAREIIQRALEAGKHVVTANKAVMASCGKQLMALADQKGLFLSFEAAVGGGIPIIGPLKHSLVGNEISTVLGIVNGTTNFMLSRMDQDGLSYDKALAEAQAKGYAEADPTADVDGFDAAAKIAILASIAFNSRVTLDDVKPEGIRAITPVDFEIAASMGYAIKLLAIAERTADGIDIRVHPTMLPVDHPMASVNGVYNAIYVIGDAVGETMFFGQGAGRGPAASAVMGDIIEVARNISAGIVPVVGCTCVDSLPIRPMSAIQSKYYVRLNVKDQAGVLAATSKVFADHNVSIYSMLQKRLDDAEGAQLVYVMHLSREADIMAALDDIARLSVVDEVASVIRIWS